MPGALSRIPSPINRGIPLPVRLASPLYFRESGGAAAGEPQDASVGLAVQTDASGVKWAYNTQSSPPQWMRVYTIPNSGLPSGLWGLTAQMYGTSSMPGVNAIYNVPQNKAIQGDDPNTGLIPGDTILIPNLAGSPTGAPTVLPTVNVTPGNGNGGITPTPVSNGPASPSSTGATPFWTTPMIAGVAVAGVAGTGLVIYLLTRKKKRR